MMMSLPPDVARNDQMEPPAELPSNSTGLSDDTTTRLQSSGSRHQPGHLTSRRTSGHLQFPNTQPGASSCSSLLHLYFQRCLHRWRSRNRSRSRGRSRSRSWGRDRDRKSRTYPVCGHRHLPPARAGGRPAPALPDADARGVLRLLGVGGRRRPQDAGGDGPSEAVRTAACSPTR